jgi:signal transduction histidine kinase
MATILIIEDRQPDRNLLTTILRTRGHEILEASDGQEALDLLAQTGPDLVISDILMPTLDGYDFVRRMRTMPARAATPVIFYTATYHEREALALARQCGVFGILTKPSPSQVILATVDAALGSIVQMPSAPLDRAGFERGHLDLVSTTLAARIDQFEAEKDRMNAVLAVAQQIAAERDLHSLLNKVCAEARDVTLAQHAVVGLLPEEGSSREMLYTCGLDAATTAGMKPPPVGSTLLSEVVQEGRSVRRRNPEVRPEELGLPADHPTVSSLLSVPIATSSRVYGWLSLGNKLGADEFTDVDERVAATLAAHAAIAYEAAHQFDDLHRRVTALERELHRTSDRVREEERAQLSRTLHDQMGQALVIVKFDFQWLASQILPVAEPSRSDITEMIDSILRRLDETMASIRAAASDLRPAVLDKLGLVAAIEWQAEEFERRSGIRCRVNSRIDEIDLEPARAAAAFGIVQEALTNVLRHAHATRATVTVRRSATALTLGIADNGRGISDRDLANGGSLGLIGMRERAVLLGGRLDVRKGRRTGTVVRLTVPLTPTRGPRGRA